jgi:hypothetical protein
MIKELLDDVVGTPPPSAVDLHGIVQRERRRGQLRLSVAAAAVAVITGVAIASGTGSDPQLAPPSMAAVDTGFRLVTDTTDSGDATARRLGIALDDAVQRQDPAARWFTPAHPSDLVRFVPGGSAANQQRFAGSGTLTLAGRIGQVSLTIVSDYDPCPAGSTAEKACGGRGGPATARLLSCAGMPGCVEGRTTAGARMLTSVSSSRPPTAGPVPDTTVLVRVQLPDRRVLELISSNLDDRGPGKSSPGQAGPVLTLRQLTAVTSDLAGRIKP